MVSRFIKIKVMAKDGMMIKKIVLKKRSKESPNFKELKNQLNELKKYIKDKNYTLLVREYETIQGNRIFPTWKKIKSIKKLEDKLILV